MIRISELKLNSDLHGFSLDKMPRFECDWALVENAPRVSTKFLRLAAKDEAGCLGPGRDFVETGLIYKTANDLDNKAIEFDYEYLPIGREFKKKVAFLDRDGVLIEDVGYPGKIEDVKFNDNIIPLLKSLAVLGYEFIVVTNQSGIARGYYDEETFLNTTNYINDYYNNNQIKILATYYCPFHPEGVIKKYTKDSAYRKPAPGMILRAAEDHGVDLKKSIMIGDRATDRINLAYLQSFIVGKTQSDVDFKNYSDLQAHIEQLPIY